LTALPETITRRIAEIRDDNTHGATSLTSRAGEIFHDWAVGMPQLSRADAINQLIMIATALCRAQPMMAPLVRLSSELLDLADRCNNSAEIAQAVMTRSRQFVERLYTHLDAVADHAAAVIPDRGIVLTHSSSSTVLEALIQAAELGKQFRVFCTESRPMLEGVLLARRLRAAGIATTLLVDAAAPTVLPAVQLVLVGGDAVTPNGLINKIGTYGLTVAAHAVSKAIYALCDSTKFLSDAYPLPDQPEHDPREILASPMPGIAVRNLYFDCTPLDLLSGMITEAGVLSITTLKHSLANVRIHPKLISNP
jgi:translation initiation factor 2B subunit (eIF-2B alpha/beta/delta family)